jgi:hypothetical protein
MDIFCIIITDFEKYIKGFGTDLQKKDCKFPDGKKADMENARALPISVCFMNRKSK